MPAEKDDYMDAIFIEKGHAALDDDLRGRLTMRLWDELTGELDLESIARSNPTAFQAVRFQQPVPRPRQ